MVLTTRGPHAIHIEKKRKGHGNDGPAGKLFEAGPARQEAIGPRLLGELFFFPFFCFIFYFISRFLLQFKSRFKFSKF
jgi:hypothetical protein